STLDGHLEETRARVAACDANIRETQQKILARQTKIKALEKDAQGSDKEADELQEDLDDEMMTRKGHEATIRTLAGTVSVVRRLPPEIVASILKMATCDLDREYRGECLINLSAVSKLWRNTALSTPSLWRSFVDLQCSLTKKRKKRRDHLWVRQMALPRWRRCRD
ncbi:hypothetical protein BKA70DRAFT_1279036, partial [Coprinopsis sp. MPI-PUGE-AT-0042]